MILADTDVLIDFLRGYAPVADRIELELQRGLATTVISAFELWSGSLGSEPREQTMASLLGALNIIPLDPASAKTAARIKGGLQSDGRAIAMADALIAGICVEHDAILLTRNRRHFEAVPRLVLGSIPENEG